jgi:hypothetical protein
MSGFKDLYSITSMNYWANEMQHTIPLGWGAPVCMYGYLHVIPLGWRNPSKVRRDMKPTLCNIPEGWKNLLKIRRDIKHI